VESLHRKVSLVLVFTIIATLLVSLSAVVLSPVNASPILAQQESPANITVHWNETQTTQSYSWSHELNAWEFGPQPRLLLLDSGNSPLSQVDPEVYFQARIMIPKSLLSGGSLGGVTLIGGRPSLTDLYAFTIHYNYTSNAYVLTQVHANISMRTAIIAAGLLGSGDSFQPPETVSTDIETLLSQATASTPTTIIELKPGEQVTVSQDATYINVTFNLKFASEAPEGTYILKANIKDAGGNTVIPGMAAYLGMMPSLHAVITLGTPKTYELLVTEQDGDENSVLFLPSENFDIVINASSQVLLAQLLLVVNLNTTQKHYILITYANDSIYAHEVDPSNLSLSKTTVLSVSSNQTQSGGRYILRITCDPDDTLFTGNNQLCGVWSLRVADSSSLLLVQRSQRFFTPHFYQVFTIGEETARITLLDASGNPLPREYGWYQLESNDTFKVELTYMVKATTFSQRSYTWANATLNYFHFNGTDVDWIIQLNLGCDISSTPTSYKIYTVNISMPSGQTTPLSWANFNGTNSFENPPVGDKIKYVITFNVNITNADVGTYLPVSNVTWTTGYTEFHEPHPVVIGDVNPLNPYLTWTVNPENGALDLDGDLSTTSDQYFVRRTFSFTGSANVTMHFLFVAAFWNPYAMRVNDDYRLFSFTGLFDVNFTYQWSDNYTWYDTSMNPLSQVEFDNINNTIHSEHGYWLLDRLTENRTSSQEDLWWAPDDVARFTWFVWHLREAYWAETAPGVYERTAIDSRFAGIFLFNDTDCNGIPTTTGEYGPREELVSVFSPEEYSSITMTRPFNSPDSTGVMTVPPGEEVTWGVSLNGVNGTLFPAGTPVWVWYMGQNSTAGQGPLGEPRNATIDKLAWDVHFTGQVGATVNTAIVKVDQYVGNWTFPDLNPSDVEGLSMGLAYRTVVSELNAVFRVDDTNVTVSSPDQIVAPMESSNFSVSTEAGEILNLQMGGTTYTWGKGGSQQNATSAALPLAVASGMLSVGLAGEDSPFAEISGTAAAYMVVSCFPKWDGYSVDNDPAYVSYLSQGTYNTGLLLLLRLLLESFTSSASTGNILLLGTLAAGALAGGALCAYFLVRRRYH